MPKYMDLEFENELRDTADAKTTTETFFGKSIVALAFNTMHSY